MESRGKLRQRLARMFRSACKPSTSASAVLDRCQPDAFDPADCGGCRAQGKRWSGVWRGKERRVMETDRCYEAGDWEGRTCPPAFSPSSPSRNSSSSSSSYYHYCFHGCGPQEQVCSRRSGRTIKKRNAMRLRSDAYGFTSETDDGLIFSSEEEKEESTTTTFFSSRTFSSYASEFYASAKKSKNVAVRRGSKRREAEAAYWPAAGGCKGSGFQPLDAVIDGGKKAKKKKQREVLLAVEKRSRNPYKDFRRSMAEMIIQRQMFRPQDLENLLQSYLALNPSPLHPLILQAFSDIWVLLFHH